MARKHYHVLIGMGGGYMPDANYYADTLASARDMLRYEKEQFLDDMAETTNDPAPYRRRRVFGSVNSGLVTYVDLSDPYDLGEYAEIVSCAEDCDPDADY